MNSRFIRRVLGALAAAKFNVLDLLFVGLASNLPISWVGLAGFLSMGCLWVLISAVCYIYGEH